MDIKDRLDSAKDRIESLKRDKIRAEASRDSAKDELKKILGELKSEHGISNVAELKARITELEGEVESKIAEAEKALDDLGR